MQFEEFNSAPTPDATEQALQFCASAAWAARWCAARPFATLADAIHAARLAWQTCEDGDLLQAFAAHPRIGDVELLRKRFAAAQPGRAVAEQGQVLSASDATIHALKELNDQYYETHGFIFIICATGLSADAMLEHLRARVDNPTEIELKNAAVEQGKIMEIRIRAHFETDGGAVS